MALETIPDGAQRLQLVGKFILDVSACDERPDIGIQPLQFFQTGLAIHAGHAQIQQQEVDFIFSFSPLLWQQMCPQLCPPCQNLGKYLTF
jgi:hypothetical protein